MTEQKESLQELAGRISLLLQKHDEQLVLAESCTGGMVAAVLTGVPSISNHFCGSAVVYQADTKQQWLNIDADILQKPGPVSGEVTQQLATESLLHTQQATLSFAITGHLGPNAPEHLDGVIYTAIASREENRKTGTSSVNCQKANKSLLPAANEKRELRAVRLQRQHLATQVALEQIERALQNK